MKTTPYVRASRGGSRGLSPVSPMSPRHQLRPSSGSVPGSHPPLAVGDNPAPFGREVEARPCRSRGGGGRGRRGGGRVGRRAPRRPVRHRRAMVRADVLEDAVGVVVFGVELRRALTSRPACLTFGPFVVLEGDDSAGGVADRVTMSSRRCRRAAQSSTVTVQASVEHGERARHLQPSEVGVRFERVFLYVSTCAGEVRSSDFGGDLGGDVESVVACGRRGADARRLAQATRAGRRECRGRSR